MKRKLLSSLAMLVLVVAGALSPVAGFFGTGETIRTAHAQATTTEEVTVKDDEDKQKSAELECGVNPACRTVKNYITAILEPTYPIAALSGFFLDYVLLGTVSSNSYSENSGLGSIAVTGWKLIRDFTNLLFIFALFAVAFNLILNVNTSGGTGASNGFGLDPKRTIARILLMALLVNFSFFLSRSIVDISNQIGLVFFNKISVTGATDSVGSSLDANNSGTENKGTLAYLYDFLGIKSISLSILANVDPQALVLNSVDDSEGTSVEILGFTAWGSYDWKTYIAMMQLAIISTLFNLFLAFIFISLGVTLMGRTLGLIFGIVLSPIAFVSFAIPSLENQPYIGFTNWFSEFAKLAVTAPILLFFMYLIITFLKAPFISPDMSGFFATAALIVIKLSAIGGLLILARRVTKDLSGRAGQIASKIAVGVASTVAVVGATAATGGVSAVGALGRRYAYEKGREALIGGEGKGLVGRIAGTARATEFEKRWGQGGLRNFNPLTQQGRRALGKVSDAGGPATSDVGQILGGITGGIRQGKLGARADDMRRAAEAAARAKAAKEEENRNKTRAVDKKITDLKKDRDDGIISKKEYEEKLKGLAQEKRDITDPTSRQQRVVASAAADVEKNKKDHADSDFDTKITKATDKVGDLTRKLSDSVDAVTASNQKLAESKKEELEAERSVLEKQKAISDSENSHLKELKDLGTKRESAASEMASADADLEALDRELAATPKIGFGVDQQRLDEMRARREQLALKKKSAADQVSEAEREITVSRTAYGNNMQTLKQERDAAVKRQNDAVIARKQAVAELDAANSSKAGMERAVADADSQARDLEAKKTASEAEIASAEGRFANAKGILEFKKSVISTQEAIARRTNIQQTDAKSRAANESRVRELKTYLENITNGGPVDPKIKT